MRTQGVEIAVVTHERYAEILTSKYDQWIQRPR